MTPLEKRRLVGQAKALPSLLQVGKNGLTDAFIKELLCLARKRGLVKVRLLKSFSGAAAPQASARELASKAGLDLVAVTGSTVVLALRKKQ